MPDLLLEVKSRLVDQMLAAARAVPCDPSEAIALHVAVSNELWWMQLAPHPTARQSRRRAITTVA